MTWSAQGAEAEDAKEEQKLLIFPTVNEKKDSKVAFSPFFKVHSRQNKSRQ